MRRNRGVSLFASILVSALVTAAVLVGMTRADRADSAAHVAAATTDLQDDMAQDNGVVEGPPAWARSNGTSKVDRGDKSSKEAWQNLTPAQKRKRMAALVEAHGEGMDKWTTCVAAAANDASKRRHCEKPLPPGLAKKAP